MHQRDAQLRRALRRRSRCPRREKCDGEAEALRPDDPCSVLDVELLAFAAVRVQEDFAVSQHTINVEHDQFDLRGLVSGGHEP